MSLLTNKKYLLLTSFAFVLFYLPFFFGGSHTHIRIHDNLDSAAVYNTVSGVFYLHPSESIHLLLGGSLPIYMVPVLDWPLTLLHLVPDRFLAYSLNDVLVRVIALLGMFSLARRLGAEQYTGFLAGILFSFSISLTALGLSVAGIPAVLYLAQEMAERPSPRICALLLLLGWNSSPVLSGPFLLALLPFPRGLFFGRALHNWLAGYVWYACALVLGSAGIFYAVFVGPPLQRGAWVLSGDHLGGAFRTFIRNQFSFGHWDFYHVSAPLVFTYLSILIAALVSKNKKLGSVIGIIVGVNAFYALVQLQQIAALRTHIGGLVKTFQFDRFYFLNSFLIIAGWVIAVGDASRWLRRVLVSGMVAQIAVTLLLTPHVQAPLLHFLGERTNPSFAEHMKGNDYALMNIPRNVVGDFLGNPTIPSFAQHLKSDDYRLIRNIIGDAVTINVGVDPMAAVANKISALDGYYNVYPSSYKAQFRSIIGNQLEIIRDTGYADDWGSTLTIADPRAYFENGAADCIHSSMIPVK